MAPSPGFGQRNAPASSLSATSTTSVPSKNSNSSRSARLERKQNSLPQNAVGAQLFAHQHYEAVQADTKFTGRMASVTCSAPMGPITRRPSPLRSLEVISNPHRAANEANASDHRRRVVQEVDRMIGRESQGVPCLLDQHVLMETGVAQHR